MLRLNPKISINPVTSALFANQKINPTECLAWIAKSEVFSIKNTKYPNKGHVSEALNGYKDIPMFSKAELATHAWFAARTDIKNANLLLALGMEDRQPTTCRLKPKEVQFIERFTDALYTDLEPMIDILYQTVGQANPQAGGDSPRDFCIQVERTFEWIMERAVDFKNSSKVPGHFQALGPVCLVPFVENVGHAATNFNTVVCAPSKECDEQSLKEWAQQVGVDEAFSLDHYNLNKPVLLLATRVIQPETELRRNCAIQTVGVTNGKVGSKLPSRT